MTTNPTTMELSISGMSCGHCVHHVSEALLGVDGVQEADVDLAGGRATVRYDAAATGAAALVAAVEEAGYTATVQGAADGSRT
jgi:copper chaperone